MSQILNDIQTPRMNEVLFTRHHITVPDVSVTKLKMYTILYTTYKI